jgi:hypothetical protein
MTDCFTFKDGRGSQALQETKAGGREGEESTSTKSKKAKKEDESGKTEDPPSRRGRGRILRQTQVNI